MQINVECDGMKVSITGNHSKLERGLLPASQVTASVIANCLGLKYKSDEWYEVLDLAAAANGEFPPDLREAELLAQLPLLFRGLRGEPPTKDECSRIINLLRNRR